MIEFIIDEEYETVRIDRFLRKHLKNIALSEIYKMLRKAKIKVNNKKVSQDYKQSENLHTYIEWALEGAEISLKEIDAVSIGMGPGSYTGLRIGTASAKGFCFGLNVPLIAVNSLESMV